MKTKPASLVLLVVAALLQAPINNGQASSVSSGLATNQITKVYIRRAGRWQVVAWHASTVEQ